MPSTAPILGELHISQYNVDLSFHQQATRRKPHFVHFGKGSPEVEIRDLFVDAKEISTYDQIGLPYSVANPCIAKAKKLGDVCALRRIAEAHCKTRTRESCLNRLA